MKISHIRISNILGIDELEFTPEGFNAITGPNGVGKTSILSAIKAATGVGHDATLLRKGAEKGEIVLVLDDGTEIQQRVTAGKTTRDVVKAGKKIAKPGDAIKALTDVLSVNPAEFLRASAKDRVKVLLDTVPFEVDLAHLSSISGVKATAQDGVHPLALIDAIRKQVYDDRTGTNRAVKEKEATINQLQLALPDAPGGVEGSEDQLRADRDAAVQTRDTKLQKIAAKLDGIKSVAAERIAGINSKAQEEIDAIRAKAQAEIDAVRADVAENEAKAEAARTNAKDTCSAAIEPLSAAIAAIVANRDAAAKRQSTLETIQAMRDDLEALEQDAQAQTKALDAIDAYKEQLIASTPIPGLSLQDGEVFLDGIAFDRVNTARQVQVALQIARLRAGELAVCCIDGCEFLDRAHLEEIEAQAEEAGLQLFVTRVVEDGDFAIQTK